jgi:hypothetical protein
MSDPKTEQAVTSAMKDIVFTINELLDKRRMFPALILLYAGIDIFGSWLRPRGRHESSSTDFKAWSDQYLLKGSALQVTADDLWGARCGLLHAATAASRSSRAGQAREICHIRVPQDFARFAQQELQKAGQNKVIVDADALFNAFTNGVMRFIQDITKDAQLREQVFFHASSISWQQSMSPPGSPALPQA